MKNEPILTIGVPVYNGERTILRCIKSLLNQNFKNFIIIVSDNASTDKTAQIIFDLMKTDERISYIRQPEKIDVTENFLLLTQNVDTPYFLWAASDDMWAPEFLQTCIDLLESNPKIGMSHTGICNIDSIDRPIRQYPEYIYFSGGYNWRMVYRFLMSPEVAGKSNLIYSVYRIDVLRLALSRYGLFNTWGADNSFALTALAISGVLISPEVLFHKRLVRPGDDAAVPLPVEIPENVLHQSCPMDFFGEYEQSMVAAVKGTPFVWLTRYVMRFRRRQLERLDRIHRGQPVNKSAWAEYLFFAVNVVKTFLYTMLRS